MCFLRENTGRWEGFSSEASKKGSQRSRLPDWPFCRGRCLFPYGVVVDMAPGSALEFFHGHHLDGIPGQFVAHLGADLAANALLLPDHDRRSHCPGMFDGRRIVNAIYRAEIHADLTPRAGWVNDRNKSGPAFLPDALRDILDVRDVHHRPKVQFRYPDRSRVSDTIG